jgi:hypothetical protein
MAWLFSKALMDSANSPSSQEQAAEFSAGTSLDGAPSALWSGTPTPQASWLPAKTTDACLLSRSGMTYKPLTDDHGEAVLTSFLAAFPVRTSAQPEGVRESKESGQECGHTWHESLARFDPDSRLWKTPQCSLLAGLDEFLETWPRWGMMLGGECWGLSTPERRTSGNESGSWPTVRSTDGERGGRGDLIQAIRGNENSHYKLWPTPDTCAGGTGPSQAKRNQPRLQDMVKWATPCARDWKEATPSPSLAAMHLNPKKSRQLTRQLSAMIYPTPQASDNRDRGNLGSGAIRRRIEKGKQIMLSQSVSDTSGALNPPWVEWLMGWPLGWTDCAASATDKFQQWRHSHGGL